MNFFDTKNITQIECEVLTLVYDSNANRVKVAFWMRKGNFCAPFHDHDAHFTSQYHDRYHFFDLIILRSRFRKATFTVEDYAS